MKRLLVLLMLSTSFLFAALNLQTASKQELMSIKGIGPKKAEQIIQYRKTNKIKSADDLKSIKGFGPTIISNVKGNKKVSKMKQKQKVKTLKVNKKENQVSKK
ncbi:ComEA family DNA-binding protein [Arcobacter sp. YIC-80]|uniref:ComEA family DNA-binding protein n=1 Tax=unclassified Arcobacter TaxID=2593671 RepID=UPI00384FB0BA